jgi:hypothetical protein
MPAAFCFNAMAQDSLLCSVVGYKSYYNLIN